MSSTTKTNFFGSKVVPTESNQNLERKAPIWQFFSQSNIEKNKAVCNLFGAALQKKLGIFMYICTFGFGFGIRPKAECFSSFGFGFG